MVFTQKKVYLDQCMQMPIGIKNGWLKVVAYGIKTWTLIYWAILWLHTY